MNKLNLQQNAILGVLPFDIAKGSKVLDVGSGGCPFEGATHLADYRSGENDERLGFKLQTGGRPYVECSVEALPFPDKYFDFVFCRHVIEHVSDPLLACSELTRVGHRGYIECPASWLEIIAPSPEHKWLVDYEEDCLIFREKLSVEKIGIFSAGEAIFTHASTDEFRAYWNTPQIFSLRNVICLWKHDLNCKVVHRKQRRGGA